MSRKKLRIKNLFCKLQQAKTSKRVKKKVGVGLTVKDLSIKIFMSSLKMPK